MSWLRAVQKKLAPRPGHSKASLAGRHQKAPPSDGDVPGLDGSDLVDSGGAGNVEPSIVFADGAPPPGAMTAKSRAELADTADAQEASPFFSRLPLEVRRQIYAEIWQDELSGPTDQLRLHIHTTINGSLRPLQHNRCIIDPDVDPEGDPRVLSPWPDWPNQHLTHGVGKWTKAPLPPDWFWAAWCLRLRWGRHWKCQERVQMLWNPETGDINEDILQRSPFLALFLTCKRMFLETSESLFSTITPVFTSSEDAHMFLVRQPHPLLGLVRSIEFNFCSTHDHLFLTAAGRCSNSRIENPCRLQIFGYPLWDELMTALQSKATCLRDFRATFGLRMGNSSIHPLRSLFFEENADGRIPIALDVPGRVILEFGQGHQRLEYLNGELQGSVSK